MSTLTILFPKDKTPLKFNLRTEQRTKLHPKFPVKAEIENESKTIPINIINVSTTGIAFKIKNTLNEILEKDEIIKLHIKNNQNSFSINAQISFNDGSDSKIYGCTIFNYRKHDLSNYQDCFLPVLLGGTWVEQKRKQTTKSSQLQRIFISEIPESKLTFFFSLSNQSRIERVSLKVGIFEAIKTSNDWSFPQTQEDGEIKDLLYWMTQHLSSSFPKELKKML